MTKEELLNKKFSIADFGERKDALYFSDLMNFFESNVVIPKGENRHPYADVLHEWVEGVKIQQSYDGNKWIDMDCVHDLFIAIVARIKPSEPTYEYQWLLFGKANDTLNHCFGFEERYLTEDETYDGVYRWVKIEETKRERK